MRPSFEVNGERDPRQLSQCRRSGVVFGAGRIECRICPQAETSEFQQDGSEELHRHVARVPSQWNQRHGTGRRRQCVFGRTGGARADHCQVV